jgi:hypothetical protein
MKPIDMRGDNMPLLSGHDGDDAKPYQEKAVRDLLREIAEAKRSTEL